MTITLKMQVDTHQGKRVSPTKLAHAIYRAIEHALDSDVAGTEHLDRDSIGQITVWAVSGPQEKGSW